MEDNKSMEVFAKAPIRKAVLQNALSAMAAMLMVLIYNLADTFFIGQTHDALHVSDELENAVLSHLRLLHQ